MLRGSHHPIEMGKVKPFPRYEGMYRTGRRSAILSLTICDIGMVWQDPMTRDW